MEGLHHSGFPEEYTYRGHFIQYKDLNELGQGGPTTGKLLIDGKEYFKHKFSGPIVFYENLICVPVLDQSWITSGFRIGLVDLNNFTLNLIGNREPLILMREVKDNKIYFFTDIYGSTEKTIFVEY